MKLYRFNSVTLYGINLVGNSYRAKAMSRHTSLQRTEHQSPERHHLFPAV